ncbi:hypothetical protein F2Q69_00029201 [Brassica cretica]|uniref:Uncharacterized protein n=1 Tax=Brassica cretica TaxID=69181 RepID=A0A8S9S9M0_BRACR|nr:hypothetical protein F2Q69_00029201 [Brassica cretica]
MDGSILNVSKEDFIELFAMHRSNLFSQSHNEAAIQPSIDRTPLSSIDGLLANGQRVYDQNGQRRFHWEAKDEYGVYRYEHGYAQAVDGSTILVSKEDIRAILERATLHKHSYICLPVHAEGCTTSVQDQDSYDKV